MSIYRILACTALALAMLSGRHVTVWVGGCPIATMPALTLIALFAAAFIVAFAFVLWRFRVISTKPAPWRTA